MKTTGENAPAELSEKDLPLDLEYVDAGLYWSKARSGARSPVFGGEVLAQALRAAGDTAPADRGVHSLHAYFVRPGDPHSRILYRVESPRDGGSFTTRRVTAQQHGKAILTMEASFHRAETSAGHQLAVADAPPPECVATPTEAFADDGETRAWFHELTAEFPVELRFVDPPPRVVVREGRQSAPRFRFWFRIRPALGPDPLTHACGVAYASDLLLLSNAAARHGLVLGQPGLRMVSLDHALWFHQPVRADDWLLYEQESLWAGRGRTLCRGLLFARSGDLVATVTQEGLFRYRPGQA